MTVRKSPEEPSKRETIAEQTSAAATEIIGKETSQRLEKTARLRAARLSQEQAIHPIGRHHGKKNFAVAEFNPLLCFKGAH